MAKRPVFGIVIEASSPLQREQVQAAIKAQDVGWWHNVGDFWLVTGKSAVEWRDLLGPIFPTPASGKLLVVKIDADAPVTWAYRGQFSDSSDEWLKKHL